MCLTFVSFSFAEMSGHQKMENMDETVTITKTQTTCPILVGPISRTVYADHDGKRVYFCCMDCVKEFKKDPAKIIKQMEAKGIVLERAPLAKK